MVPIRELIFHQKLQITNGILSDIIIYTSYRLITELIAGSQNVSFANEISNLAIFFSKWLQSNDVLYL